jgi:CPA1 family monovalent cation:H+ antiporter
MRREEMLKNVPIFSELGRRDLERLSKLMVPRAVRGGEVIIKEGDQAAGFFVISSGWWRSFGESRATAAGVERAGTGDFFGEMALFEGFPNATVVRPRDTGVPGDDALGFMAEMKNHGDCGVDAPVLVRQSRS